MMIDNLFEVPKMSESWKMAFKYNLPHLLAMCICEKTSGFPVALLCCDNEKIYNALNACIAEEWGEGVVIVEQEIARRGLHGEDNEGRFEL